MYTARSWEELKGFDNGESSLTNSVAGTARKICCQDKVFILCSPRLSNVVVSSLVEQSNAEIAAAFALNRINGVSVFQRNGWHVESQLQHRSDFRDRGILTTNCQKRQEDHDLWHLAYRSKLLHNSI